MGGLYAISALDRPAPTIGALSRALVKAFAFMVRNPGQWWRVAQISAGSGAAPDTVFKRFDNLVMAGALKASRFDDHRHYMLAPDWQAVPLAAELHRRGLNVRLPGEPADAFQGPENGG